MTKKNNSLTVVGIGASAGGLEALRQTLPSLPDQEDIAYIIVQHMDPHHQSMLVSLLVSSTVMKVREAENNLIIQPNQIYITPSGFDITLEGEKLVLRKTEALIGPRPSIDRFMISLANQKGERAVGIILSGTGSDGAHGMKAIKAGGGITIAQKPETAKYEGMPKSAIRTGSIDLILPTESIGSELVSILHSPLLVSGASAIIVAPDDMGELLALLRKHTGYDLSGYKENTVQRRIKRRLAVHKLKDLKEYVAYANENPADLQALVKDIWISVTSFFRDRQAFDALEKIIPGLVDKRADNQPIRVWVPGCASGEEAYSLAILFAEHFGETFGNTNLQFYATDVDADVVAQARKGVYPAASLENIDKNIIEKYFIQDNGSYRVIKSIRERIVFAKQDIINDPPFSRLDLIACRNLLIYFQASLQSRVLKMFHYVLKSGGVLFLGKSESVAQCANLFQPIAKKWRIFRREGITHKIATPYQEKNLPGSEFGRSLLNQNTKVELSLREIVNHAITNFFGPPAVLINNRLELIYVRGDASKYFQIGEGSTGLSVLDLVRPELRSVLRTSIHRAQREHITVISKKNRAHLPEGNRLYTNLHVHPLDFEGVPDGFLLVAFEEEAAPGLNQQHESSDTESIHDQRIIELEHELAAAYERLQTTVEELETSNEELQSLNEELQSANEELQSTNEELVTSNEELQATNEELSTVNQELQVKSAELAEANSDLENVFRRMNIPFIVIDKEMKVRRFTPSVDSLFNIMPGDQGQVITNLGTRVTIPDFRQLLDNVLKNGKTTNHTIASETKIYEFKIYPYYEEDKTISGALLTFYDMTSVYQREQEFQALAENAPDIVARYDLQLRHLYLNKTIETYTGRNKDEFIGKTNRELGMPEKLCQIWEDEIRKPLSTYKQHIFEFDFPASDGTKHFESRVVPEFSTDGRVKSLLLVSRDITMQKLYLLELDDTLRSISDGFFSLDSELRFTYFNEAAGKLLNRDPADVLCKNIFDAFPEAAGSVFEEQYRDAMELGQNRVFETFFEKEPYRNWYSVRVYPKDNGISVYFQVITAQKQAENEIKHHKEMLQAIIDNAPVMITMFDEQTNVLMVNRAFEKNSGWTQDEINTVDIMEKCYPAPEYRAEVLQYMQNATTEWREIEMTTKAGVAIDTIWSNVKLDDNTQIGIGLDITDKKKIEDSLREKQKTESLGILAGGIAHDFNNILTVILGNAELAKGDLPESSPIKYFLKAILQAGNRATELVQQILTFSRNQKVDKQALKSSPIIIEALKFIRSTLPTTVEINEDIGSDCGLILANETNIHQLIVNLCTNAIHAMEDEKGELSVKLAQVQLSQADLQGQSGFSAGPFVELSVEDSGCGMDKETMAQIFDPYFTTKEVGKGSGLGLAVVHGIVQSCGGFIQVKSNPGSGSQFQVYFPVIEAQSNDDIKKEKENLSTAPYIETILFVDDEEAIVNMNKQLLERYGYKVVGVTSSETALSIFRTSPQKFDLVITDQTMPRLSGAGLAGKMLEIRSDIAIILCSGYSTVITDKEAKLLGIKKFLMKPVEKALLLSAIREVVDDDK